MFGALVGQWTREMNHVSNFVGGIYEDNKHVGQQGKRLKPVPAERQRAAVKFMNDNLFITPSFFLKPEILQLVSDGGVEAAQHN
jgi:hypothetical protein